MSFRLKRITITAGIIALLALLLLTIFSLRPRTDPQQALRRRTLRQLSHDLEAQTPWYWQKLEAYACRQALQRQPVIIPGFVLRAELRADMRTYSRIESAKSELIRRGTNAWPAIPDLVKLLARQNPGTRQHALEALTEMQAGRCPEFAGILAGEGGHPEVAEALLQRLRFRFDQSFYPRNAKQRRFVLVGLAALGQPARPALPDLCLLAGSKDDHEDRALAIGVLEQLGPLARDAVPLLKTRLLDQDEWPDVRAAGARALAAIAPDTPELRVLLKEMLRDQRALVRVGAAGGLWRLTAPASEIVPVLTNALTHKLVSIQVAALETLAQMGPAAQTAGQLVRHQQLNQNERVRTVAVIASRKIEGQHQPVDRNPR